MASRHTVKSYDADLDLLKAKISEMGREVEDQIDKANQALLNRDNGLAELVKISDEKVNVLQQESEELGVRILATRQPLAQDLRSVIAGLKIASELERIADYAANIAKNVMDLDRVSLEKPVGLIIRMAELASHMLKDVIVAYREVDVRKATAVWHRDEDINKIYADLLSHLRSYMKADSDNINVYTSLIFAARCCERIGDHIKNVDESVYFITHDESFIENPIEKKQHA